MPIAKPLEVVITGDGFACVDGRIEILLGILEYKFAVKVLTGWVSERFPGAGGVS